MNEKLGNREIGNDYSSFNLADYENESFYPLLLKLPKELAQRALAKIESNLLDDAEAAEYLQELIDHRRKAMTETQISDEEMSEAFNDEFFTYLEEELFGDTKQQIGHGRTAKVHATKVEHNGEEVPVAVKYLISPIKGTLSSSEEHEMLREVERLQTVEKIENELNETSDHLKVPHPYFHHKTNKVECYGMQKIDGCDLERGAAGIIKPEVMESLLNSDLMKLDIEEIDREIEEFFQIMHKYCLHGDIKPANIMVDSNGKLYVIDFGQSVLMSDVPEKGLDQMNNLMADEIAITKRSVRDLLWKLKELQRETFATAA